MSRNLRKFLQVRQLCLILCAILTFQQSAKATHLMGGDLTYKNIGSNRVEVRFYVYRDCNGGQAAMDNSITYRIYNGQAVANNSYTSFSTRTVNLTTKSTVKPEAPNCGVPTGVCVELGLYIDTFTLGTDTVGFHVSWYRNERNQSSITNLTYGNCFSGTKRPYGSIWYTFIPRRTIPNNTPQFLTNPIPFMCAGRTTKFNPLVSDPDKDSLVFSLETPYSPPASCSGSAIPTPFPLGHSSFQTVTYASGYSVSNPFGSGSSISINSTTGEITAYPANTGSYVIAIQVKEYRVNPITKKVTYVGVVRRDLQFVVGSCNSSTPPQFANDTLGTTRYINPGDTLCIKVEGASGTDSVYIDVNGGIFQKTPTINPPYATGGKTKGYKKATNTFCWTPTCDHITFTSPHIVTVSLSDQNCNVQYRVYSIYVRTRPILNAPVIRCIRAWEGDSNVITWRDTLNSKRDSVFRQYKIYRAVGSSSTYTLVDSIPKFKATGWTDKNATRNDSIIYKYFVVAQNSCGLEGYSSDTVSSVVVTHQILSDKGARISWNSIKPKNTRYYRLYEVPTTGSTALIDSTLKTNYVVKRCSTSFRPMIQLYDTLTKCVSQSRIGKVVTFQDITAPAMGNRIQTVNVLSGTKVQVVYNKSDSNDIKEYILYRKKGNNNYAKVATIPKSASAFTFVYDDALAQDTVLNEQLTYKVATTDTCGNYAESTPHRPIQLKGNASQLSNELRWTKYQGNAVDTVEVQKYIGGVWKQHAYIGLTDSTYADLNLSCNTKHYYRIVHRTSENRWHATSDSIELVPFDTIAPANVNIKMVTVRSGSRIAVQFDKVADVDVKEYKVYRSENGGAYTLAGTHALNTAATLQEYLDNGLTTTTKTYSYRVFAVDSCAPNTSKASETHTAMQLTGQGQNLANRLTWSSYKGFSALAYDIQRLDGGVWTKIGQTADTAYSDQPLNCNVQRHYRVVALGGSSEASVSDSIALTPFDTIAPAEVDIINVSALNGSTVQVRFYKVPDVDVKIYRVFRSSNGGAFSLVKTVNVQTGSVQVYNDSLLSATTNTYSYRVYAVDSCNSNISKTTETHTLSQMSGQGLNLSNGLRWTSYKGYAPTGYDVQRLDAGAWAKIGETTDTFYVDQPLNCNVQRHYRVVAKGAASERSASDSVALTPFDTIAPAEVDIISVSVLDSSTTQLRFNKVPDVDVKVYRIMRSVNGGAYSLLKSYTTLTTDPQVYNDSNLSTSKNTYSYQVIAMDSCNSNLSKTTETHTQIQLSGISRNLANRLTWTGYVGYTPTTYEVQRLDNSIWTTIGNAASTTFDDAPLNCNVKRSYRVRALGAGGEISISDTLSLTPYDTIKPMTPTITAVDVVGNNRLALRWTASSSDVKIYLLQRKESGQASFSNYDTIYLSTNYVDTNVNVKTKTYCYRVVAMDSCANNLSAPSAEHCSMLLRTLVNGCEQKINLSWNAHVGYDAQLTGYKVYRRPASGIFSLIANVATSANPTYIDAAINNFTTYEYRIVAVGASDSSVSNDSMDRLFKPEPAEILAASKTVTGDGTMGEITLTWKDQSASKHMSYHRIFARKVGAASLTLLADNIPVSQKSLVHKPLNTLEDNYEYQMVTIDSCGNISDSSTIHRTMVLEMTVGQLVHDVRWTPYLGKNLAGYIVQYRVSGNFVNVDTVSAFDTQYVLLPAPCNQAVFYRIAALGTDGVTALSDTAGGQAIDTIPSNAPTFENLTTIANTQNALTFIGSDSADMYGYAIMRRNLKDTNFITREFVQFTSAGANHLYIDLTADNRTSNCYVVVALDSCLNATASDTFCSIGLDGIALNQANRLTYSAYKGYGVNDYKVERQNLVSGVWEAIAINTNADAVTNTVVDTPLACGVPRMYRITAVEQAGSRVTMSRELTLVPFDTIIPNAPSINSVSAEPGIGNRLRWQWDTQSDVKYFQVYRKDSVASAASLIATVTYDSTYLDAVTPLNNRYTYHITAIDSCDASHVSAPSMSHETIKLMTWTNECYPVSRMRWSRYNGFGGQLQGYEIWRSQDASTYNVVGTVAATDNYYEDLTVLEGMRYYYQIRAVTNNPNIASSSDTQSVVPYVFPLSDGVEIVQASVTATSKTNGVVVTNWNMLNTLDTFVRGYRLYHSTTGMAGSFTKVFETTNFNTRTFTHAGLNTSDSAHYYYVVTFNGCLSESLVADTHRVVSLSANARNMAHDLTWTNYLGFTVGDYEVERSIAGGPYNVIYKLPNTVTTFTDSSLTCGVRYNYRIKAYEIGSTSIVVNSDTISMIAFDTIAPQVSEVVAASVLVTSTTGGEVELEFTPAPEQNRRLYEVYRQLGVGPKQLVAIVNQPAGASNIIYVDKALNTKNRSYKYTVVSVDSCGNKAEEGIVHNSILLDATAFSTYNEVTWNDYSAWSGDVQYILERRVGALPFAPIATLPDGTLSYRDGAVKCEVVYDYRIRAERMSNTALRALSNTDTAKAFEFVRPKESEIVRVSVSKTGGFDGAVELNWPTSTSTDVERYLIYRKSTSNPIWQNIAFVDGSITNYVDQNINTYRHAFSYRIVARDTCGNLSYFDSVQTHTSITMRVDALNEAIKVSWTPYEGWPVASYEIYRNGQLITTLDGAQTSWTDSQKVCTRLYTYYVLAKGTNAVISLSNTDSTRAQDYSAPVAAEMVLATVSEPNKTVKLIWTRSKSWDAGTYTLYRRSGNTADLKIVASKIDLRDTVYIDSTADLGNGSICYQVVVEDSCGNTSLLSNVGCTMPLKAVAMDQYNVINWEHYRSWSAPIAKYHIYRKEDAAPWVMIDQVAGDINQYEDRQLNDTVTQFCYRVEAVSGLVGQDSTAWSMMDCANQASIVWIPASFSPTESVGLNDFFGPKGLYFQNYTMTIINRWGQEVYSTTDGKPWDGHFRGKVVEQGVYGYSIEIIGVNGEKVRKRGYVTIIL